MTLVDAKLQGVVEGSLAGGACEIAVPGFVLRRIEYRSAYTGLEDDCVDVNLLIVVEDATEFGFLQSGCGCIVGTLSGPVEAAYGGEPYGTGFVLGMGIDALVGQKLSLSQKRKEKE